MPDDVVYSFDQLFTYILLYFVLFKVQNTFTATPITCVRVIHKSANKLLFFSSLSIFTVVIDFFLSLIHTVSPWRPATSIFLVNFKEDYISLVTDICSTKRYIPSFFVHKISWNFLILGFSIISFKPNLWRYYF